MKTLALAALFALASSSAFAQSIADPVPGHGEVTYFDLMKQVVPDLTLSDDGATGHLPDGIEHIDGPDGTGETPEVVTIDTISVETVKADGRDMLWVLADLGEGGNIRTYTLLAVFDATGFVDEPFAISADNEAMMVGSEHFNSSQNYQQRTLAHIYEGKLQVIADFSLFGTRGCEEWTTDLTR